MSRIVTFSVFSQISRFSYSTLSMFCDFWLSEAHLKVKDKVNEIRDNLWTKNQTKSCHNGSDCAIRKHNARDFLQIRFWNTLGLDLDYNSCGMTFLLARCIPSVKWGLLMCLVGIVLDVGPSQVLFWFCLFPPLLSPFRQKSDGGVTLLDCSTNTTGWCMRRVSSGKAAILQAISGLTQQELCTICTHCMELARGRGRWAGGGERLWVKCWENWGLQAVTFAVLQHLKRNQLFCLQH